MTLTTAQLQALKADAQLNSNTIPAGQPWTNSFAGQQVKNVFALTTSDSAATVAGWYNQAASPAWWAWVPTSSTTDTGKAIKMSDVGGLTTANSTRLQVSFQIRPGGFAPSNQDDRALFGGLFSVAGAAGTRANLLAVWQRQATCAEKLFGSGTGTQATDVGSDGSVSGGSPGLLAFSGNITGDDVSAARAS